MSRLAIAAVCWIQPWTEEQIEMMIDLGKMIYGQFNRIGVRDHHGHHDLCPGYKNDVIGFPFARVLSGIYRVRPRRLDPTASSDSTAKGA